MRPGLKLSVACWSSEKEKLFQEGLKRQKSTSAGVLAAADESLTSLPDRHRGSLGTTPTGGKVASRRIDFCRQWRRKPRHGVVISGAGAAAGEEVLADEKLVSESVSAAIAAAGGASLVSSTSKDLNSARRKKKKKERSCRGEQGGEGGGGRTTTHRRRSRRREPVDHLLLSPELCRRPCRCRSRYHC